MFHNFLFKINGYCKEKPPPPLPRGFKMVPLYLQCHSNYKHGNLFSMVVTVECVIYVSVYARARVCGVWNPTFFKYCDEEEHEIEADKPGAMQLKWNQTAGMVNPYGKSLWINTNLYNAAYIYKILAYI